LFNTHIFARLFTTTLVFATLFSAAQKPRFKEKRTAKRVKKHITYLASDELEGRATATDGEYLSAKYIANQFEQLGLSTFVENSYFQIMGVPKLRMAQEATSLNLGGREYELFTHFYPISLSKNQADYQGAAINVGYGIEDEKLERNDYAGKSVEGQAVIINIDLPGGTHPHSKFVAWSGLEKRVNHAIAKGAKAVILYTVNEDLKPNGSLAKSTHNAGIPVVFVEQELDPLDGLDVTIHIDILMMTSDGHNVLGYIDHGAEHTVVVGAHHDHLGHGQLGGSLAERVGDIHNGADDNASGTAALIELAREVKKHPKRFSNNNYLFIAFTGEEQGLKGSKYFVNSGLLPAEKISYMINMDMVGHLDSTQKTLIINGVGTSPSWNKAIENVDYSTKKIAKVKTTESGIGASDHTSFYLNDIPSVHFFTGQHQYYHKPGDDVEIVNFGGEAFVISYICRMMMLMDQEETVEFTKTKDENQGKMSFKVTLGIMPDYVYDGEGLRVDGVKEGRVGYKAGLDKGDIIVAVGDKKIENIQDYMSVLSSLEKGTKTTLTIRRGDETKVLNAQF